MRRAGGFAAIALLVAGAFLLGFVLTRPAESGAPAGTGEASPQRPVALIDEVRSDLRQEYYRSIDPTILRRATVDKLIRGLDDPHTEYLTPAEFEVLEERTEGTYSGVGLTVGPAKSGLLVTSAFKGPAQKAGIREGDVIIRIDGKPAGRMPFERSLALIKGEKGTIVRLTVRRSHKRTIKFQVVRQEIDVPPIKARLLRSERTKLAYIRVLSFPDGTADQLQRTMARLVELGAEGAIVDLRDNPGGLLSQAVDTVSLYLAEGVVCTTDGAHQEFRTYAVSGEPTHPNLPLVVLVNGGSASAAEIVAAALHENNRATLVGDRTFGKASVQSIEPLSNGGALKLTTAKYATPLGVDISERGLRPKIKALDDPLTRPDEGLAVARKVLLRLVAS
jgi:carboxyl-terminal processing protease